MPMSDCIKQIDQQIDALQEKINFISGKLDAAKNNFSGFIFGFPSALDTQQKQAIVLLINMAEAELTVLAQTMTKADELLVPDPPQNPNPPDGGGTLL